MGEQPAIEAIGLEKSYGDTKVLTGLDLSVPKGSLLALLGPNGAGKTTTVRILSTLLRADAGQARVAGFDVRAQRREVRSRISLTGQFAAIDGLQTGEENLRMMARLSGLPPGQARRRAAELLERFDLTAAAKRRAETYSGGMRRRLDLAAGLVGQPEVIFLDEPTTGLDPRSKQQMWEVITGLLRAGVTVLLTTQYLLEADELADRVVVMDGGRKIAEGTPAQLKHDLAGARLDMEFTTAATFGEVAGRLGHRAVHADQATLTIGVPTDGSSAHVRNVLDELDPRRISVTRFSVHTPTLDDVFLTLTGHGAAGPASDLTQKESSHV
jgi:ABC-2 type transport system ATP-binding protein